MTGYKYLKSNIKNPTSKEVGFFCTSRNIRKQKQPKPPHHPSDCKAGAQEKAVPLGNNKHKQSVHIRKSLSLGREMSQRDREGRLAINFRLPPNPATAKQEPEMSRPLWGKVAPTGDGRGELASYLDCPTTNAPTPTPTMQTKPHQTLS